MASADGGGLGWRAGSGWVPARASPIEGVSSSSLLALQSELFRAQEARRASPSERPRLPSRRKAGVGVSGPGPSSNPGVAQRQLHDSSTTVDQATNGVRSSLERKAEEYNRLAAGQCDPDEEEMYDVDFVRKGIDKNAVAELQRRREIECEEEEQRRRERQQSSSHTKRKRADDGDDEDDLPPEKRKPPKWHPAYEGNGSSDDESDAESDDKQQAGGRHRVERFHHRPGLGARLNDDEELSEEEQQRRRQDRINTRHQVASEAVAAREHLTQLRQQRREEKRKRQERLKEAFIRECIARHKASKSKGSEESAGECRVDGD